MIKGNLEKDDRLFFVRAALCDGTFFLDKPIYCINRDCVENLSRMYKLSDYWFFD